MYKRIHVEISNICNVQCSFCPVVERPKDIMDIENFKGLLLQLVPITEDICLHLMGEPLAHPQFNEIIDICSKMHAKVQITTNALLIKKFSEKLLESKSLRQINFSLQAFVDNFPERSLTSYMNPILDFCDRAVLQREDLFINFRLWNLPQGHDDLAINEQFFKILEDHFDLTIKRKVDTGNIKSKKLFSDKKLYLHFDSRFEWPDMKNETIGDIGTCHGLRNHFGIHADGTIVPCCLDKEATINLGNAFELPVIDILNSKRAVMMRTGFENGKIIEEFCKRCSFRTRFSK